ncbi:MAG: hypothetical protein J5950_01015 [Clostridia bacterium]|nr:hypothetical protein [Clostridia bacterium]
MNTVLIELYDNDALENIISLQLSRYDKLVFMCFKDSDPDQKKRAVIRDIITSHTGTEVLFEEASEKNIDSAIKAFDSLLERFPDSFFVADMTGGDEIFIAALSRFVSNGNVSRFSVHKSDVNKGSLTWMMGAQEPVCAPEEIALPFSFSDIIKLYGGAVIGSWPEEFSTIMAKKRYEILRVWNAVKDMSADWNKFCSISYVNGVDPDENGVISRKFSKENEITTSERIMQRLEKRGIVKNYEVSRNYLKYKLQPSAETTDLYISSGTALEMYTALAAAGTGLFRECYTKVLLDCDGIISKWGSDPTNELDVTIMYGFVPIFISCKNTEPTKEFLYEIKTMADHFGGKYGLPMLVSSKPAFQPVRERAKEMHIMLIDDVQSLSLKEFRAAIIKTIRKQSEL